MINIPKASRFALISNRIQDLILIVIVIVIRGFLALAAVRVRVE